MAVSFYINGWDHDLDDLLFGDVFDNDNLMFSKSFRDWCKENNIEPFFVSRSCQRGGVVLPVKYSIFTATYEQYDCTIAKYDALYFEEVSDAVLFKLTWI